MAFAPIALTIPQYDKTTLANWWLKAYDQGTTTPLSIATDAGGGTLLAKVELDSEGFPLTAGSARFIPFIDGDYDLWCFPTAAEADANDTTNAIQFADNLNADPESSITFTAGSYTVANKASAVLLTPVSGKTLYIESEDGGLFKPVFGAAATYSDDGGSNCGTVFIPTGGDGSAGWERDFDGGIYVAWFGLFVSNGRTVDVSAEYLLANAAAAAANKNLLFPYAEYLIDTEMNAFRVGHIGLAADNKTTLFTGSTWPVLVQGPTVVDFIRVGQPTASNLLVDGTAFEGFTIDMIGAPTNARGLFCDYGLLRKKIHHVYARGDNEATTAAIVAKNKSGIELNMSDTATQGLYYLDLHDLTGFYLNRGFYTSGDSGDGLRISTIGLITTWNCPQAQTFKDSSNNSIAQIGLQSFMSDYDPSNATEWGLWMDNRDNTIVNLYIENAVDAFSPYVFMTSKHSISLFRELTRNPNLWQVIDESGVRITADQPGNNRSLVVARDLAEVGTIAGTQVQRPINVNPYFKQWQGGSVNIADATVFAYDWTSVKSSTGTLRITQSTGSGTGSLYNSSVYLGITTPVVGGQYGFKQDIVNYFPLNGTVLSTLSRELEYVTIAVKIRPFNTNAVAMRFRIAVDDGVLSGNEDYTIAYDPATAGVDEKIKGKVGAFWTLIYHHGMSVNASKLEVTTVLYPATTHDHACYVDSVVVIAGRHTQYAAKPLIETPARIEPLGLVANVNTPAGVTAYAAPVFDPVTGALVGYTPVYPAQW